MAVFQTVISDLKRAERQLEKQLESVRAAKAAMEQVSLRRGQPRGGRRRMSAAQRRAVSKRMKKYWAARRKMKKE
jgi:hypothetical protein